MFSISIDNYVEWTNLTSLFPFFYSIYLFCDLCVWKPLWQHRNATLNVYDTTQRYLNSCVTPFNSMNREPMREKERATEEDTLLTSSLSLLIFRERTLLLCHDCSQFLFIMKKLSFFSLSSIECYCYGSNWTFFTTPINASNQFTDC